MSHRCSQFRGDGSSESEWKKVNDELNVSIKLRGAADAHMNVTGGCQNQLLSCNGGEEALGGDAGHGGEIVSLRWPRNALVFPWISCRTWMERAMSLVRLPPHLGSGKAEDGWILLPLFQGRDMDG